MPPLLLRNWRSSAARLWFAAVAGPIYVSAAGLLSQPVWLGVSGLGSGKFRFAPVPVLPNGLGDCDLGSVLHG